MGWLSGKTIKLTDVRFELSTPNVTAAVQSLDNNTIRESNNMPVSLASTSVLYKDLNDREKLPFLSQPVKGSISIRSVEGLSLYRVDAAGNHHDFDIVYQDGLCYRSEKLPLTHWLILTADGKQD